MKTIRAAAIQMVSTTDVDANLSIAEELIRQAADEGATFIVLPEYFPIISHNERDKLQYQEPYGTGPIQTFLADNARQHAIWLVGGTIPLESGQTDRVFNSCLLFNPQGECISRYDKIHLFDVCINHTGNESYNESNTIHAGDRIVVAKTPFANIGISVCYDLRFPELYRKMLKQEISIIVVPSSFTEATGKHHWEILLRTRAVENLCFVVAPNQGGKHAEKRFTWGHSMIIDPWGDILGVLDKGPGVVCADLDLARLQKLRNSFPSLRHQKLLT